MSDVMTDVQTSGGGLYPQLVLKQKQPRVDTPMQFALRAVATQQNKLSEDQLQQISYALYMSTLPEFQMLDASFRAMDQLGAYMLLGIMYLSAGNSFGFLQWLKNPQSNQKATKATPEESGRLATYQMVLLLNNDFIFSTTVPSPQHQLYLDTLSLLTLPENDPDVRNRSLDILNFQFQMRDRALNLIDKFVSSKPESSFWKISAVKKMYDHLKSTEGIPAFETALNEIMQNSYSGTPYAFYSLPKNMQYRAIAYFTTNPYFLIKDFKLPSLPERASRKRSEEDITQAAESISALPFKKQGNIQQFNAMVSTVSKLTAEMLQNRKSETTLTAEDVEAINKRLQTFTDAMMQTGLKKDITDAIIGEINTLREANKVLMKSITPSPSIMKLQRELENMKSRYSHYYSPQTYNELDSRAKLLQDKVNQLEKERESESQSLQEFQKNLEEKAPDDIEKRILAATYPLTQKIDILEKTNKEFVDELAKYSGEMNPTNATLKDVLEYKFNAGNENGLDQGFNMVAMAIKENRVIPTLQHSSPAMAEINKVIDEYLKMKKDLKSWNNDKVNIRSFNDISLQIIDPLRSSLRLANSQIDLAKNVLGMVPNTANYKKRKATTIAEVINEIFDEQKKIKNEQDLEIVDFLAARKTLKDNLVKYFGITEENFDPNEFINHFGSDYQQATIPLNALPTTMPTKLIEMARSNQQTEDQDASKSELDKLNSEMKDLKDKLAKAKERAESLKTDVDTLRTDKTQLEDNVTTLEREKKTLETDVQTYKENIEKIENDLNKSATERTQEKTSIEQQLKDAQAKIDKFTIDVGKKDNEIQRLEGLKKSNKESLDALKEKIEKLQNDYTSSNAKVDNLQETINDNDATIKSKEDALTNAKKDYDILKSRYDALKKDFKTKQDELFNSNVTITSLRQDIKRLNRQIEELKAQVGTLEENNKSSSDALRQAQEDAATQLEKLRSDAEKDVAVAQKKAADLEREKQEMEKKQNEDAANATRNNKAWERQKQEFNDRIATLDVQLKRLKTENTQLQSSEETASSQYAQDLQTKINQVNAKWTENDDKRRETYSKRIQELNGRIDALNTNVKDHLSTISGLRIQIITLTQNGVDAKEEIKRLTEDLTKEQERARTAEESLMKAKEDIVTLKNEKRKLEGQIMTQPQVAVGSEPPPPPPPSGQLPGAPEGVMVIPQTATQAQTSDQPQQPQPMQIDTQDLMMTIGKYKDRLLQYRLRAIEFMNTGVSPKAVGLKPDVDEGSPDSDFNQLFTQIANELFSDRGNLIIIAKNVYQLFDWDPSPSGEPYDYEALIREIGIRFPLFLEAAQDEPLWESVIIPFLTEVGVYNQNVRTLISSMTKYVKSRS